MLTNEIGNPRRAAARAVTALRISSVSGVNSPSSTSSRRRAPSPRSALFGLPLSSSIFLFGFVCSLDLSVVLAVNEP